MNEIDGNPSPHLADSAQRASRHLRLKQFQSPINWADSAHEEVKHAEFGTTKAQERRTLERFAIPQDELKETVVSAT